MLERIKTHVGRQACRTWSTLFIRLLFMPCSISLPCSPERHPVCTPSMGNWNFVVRTVDRSAKVLHAPLRPTRSTLFTYKLKSPFGHRQGTGCPGRPMSKTTKHNPPGPWLRFCRYCSSSVTAVRSQSEVCHSRRLADLFSCGARPDTVPFRSGTPTLPFKSVYSDGRRVI